MEHNYKTLFVNEFSSGGPHDTKDPEQAFPHWRWTFIALSNASTVSRPLFGPKLNETVPLKLGYFFCRQFFLVYNGSG